MKQNKLLILSLLASFLLLFSASYSYGQNAVTFGTVTDCPKPAGATVDVPVLIDNDVDLAALDIIGQIVSDGNVDLVVSGVAFDNRMSMPEVLDQRYPIGDLGGGIFRLGAVELTGGEYLVPGSGQIATLTLTYISDCDTGLAAILPADYDCNGVIRSTTFTTPIPDCFTPDVIPGAVHVVNTDPYFTYCPADTEIYWGDTYNRTLTADDDDIACGCDGLAFSKVSGPGTINATTGLYQYTPPGTDVGCQPVVIVVTDNYGGTDTCEWLIEVLNMPPEITCPDEVINTLWGHTVVCTVTAVDPDNGPQGMTFSLIENPPDYPGNPEIDPVTGEFVWVTSKECAFVGLWEFCVIVTDHANLDQCNTENADTCCFYVHVDRKFDVTIEKIHDQLQGHYTYVSITLDSLCETMLMGGFDFLIAYDASALAFIGAEPGQLLVNCGWEYFTYRFGAFGNCGPNACPSGLLRLVAIAETNNGPNHPDCFSNMYGTELAVMEFYVTNDRTFECQFVPIYFFWFDCGDNTISSRYGDTLFIEQETWWYGCHEGHFEVTDHTFGFPGAYGVPDECLIGDKEFPLRAIDFWGGGIDIICADSIDARGDINVNGLPYEIADAVMLTNYFISGLSAFGDHVEASIAASDANADGITLSVADLVYLVRVVQGDAQPYPKLVPGADDIIIKTQHQADQLAVTYDATTDMGAVWMRFEFTGSVGVPTLGDGAAGMELKYGVNGNELNVLVYDLGSDAIENGQHSLMTIPVTGEIKLVEMDAADFNGNVVNMSDVRLPTKFGLAQNYPNPFNPTTTIELALPVASEFSVAIYNVAGQLIRTYDGYANAGVVKIEWDGRDASGDPVASGIYFYKANANEFAATKKMLLMK
jgi:hypothetical protein